LSDILSTLSSYYASAAQNEIPVGAKFAKVDPTQYQGTWTGKDSTGHAFSLAITKVKGYRANVAFNSSSGFQYGRVFITSNSSFRIGDSSFSLMGNSKALLATVITDPNTGIQTIEKSVATLNT
jgi:hypothetical protein